MLNSIKNYTRQVGRYWYLFLAIPRYSKLLREDHEGILDAFRLRNSKMARERVEDHINSFGRIVVESLRSISPIALEYSDFL